MHGPEMGSSPDPSSSALYPTPNTGDPPPMRLLLALVLAALCSCNALGGSTVQARGSTDGLVSYASDGASAIVVYSGSGALSIDAPSAIVGSRVPLWLFEYDGEGVFVWVKALDISSELEFGVPLPASTRPYVENLLSPAEIEKLGLTFEPEG